MRQLVREFDYTTDVAVATTFSTGVHAVWDSPKECLFLGVELNLKAISGATKLSCVLCYDTLGVDAASAVSAEQKLFLKPGSTALGSIRFDFGAPLRHKEDTGKYYLYVISDAGTCTVDAARFLWSQRAWVN